MFSSKTVKLTNSIICANILAMEAKERYRIKGKIYYKISEEPLKESDRDIADGIWQMQNSKGELFKLLIARGGRRYTLYNIEGNKVILKTTSISKVVRYA